MEALRFSPSPTLEAAAASEPISPVTLQLRFSKLIDITYHPFEDDVPLPIKLDRSTGEMHLHHSHPTTSKTIQLMAEAVAAGDLAKASFILERVSHCSLSLASATVRDRPDIEIDNTLLQTVLKQDTMLQESLLKQLERLACHQAVYKP